LSICCDNAATHTDVVRVCALNPVLAPYQPEILKTEMGGSVEEYDIIARITAVKF